MGLHEQGADFLAGGGEMGARTRAFDWSSTSLGAPGTWPQSLRVTVRLMLNTQHPMFIWWGPELIQFYNDAYRKTMGPERHPSALGARGRECWAEIWDIIGPQIEFVMSGQGSTWDEDRLVPVTRHGRREDVWWTYSYGPIDLEGGVGGVLVICNDVTAQHLASAALKDQTMRLQHLFEQAPSFTAVLSGPDHRFEIANASYKRLIGGRDVIGKSVREALPEIEAQGFVDLLDAVYRSGEAHVGRQVPLMLQTGDTPAKAVFLDFVYQPIVDAGGQVSGIFVEGMDVTDHMHAEDRLRMLNEELKHRVKNTLAVVGAIAGQTLRGTDKGAVHAFNARLSAFGRAHDILTANSHTRAPIGEIVDDALTPHRTDDARFRVSGPPIMLESKQALSLSLAMHELATNAFKYGSLSQADGHVEIAWSVDDDADAPTFRFLWKEVGGPPVEPPARKGFGTQLLQRVLAGDFSGQVELQFATDGFRLLLTAPLPKQAPG